MVSNVTSKIKPTTIKEEKSVNTNEIMERINEVTEELNAVKERYIRDKNVANSVGKILGTVGDLQMDEKDGQIDIYYENNLFPFAGTFKEREIIILAMMILYTDFSYKVLKSEKYVSEAVFDEFMTARIHLAKIVEEICMSIDVKELTSENNLKMLKEFLRRNKQRLYICGKSAKPERAEGISRIREVYQNFKIRGEYIYFYDILSETKQKIRIEYGYTFALTNLYANAYLTTVIWLQEIDPSGQWCFCVPWNVLQDLRMVLENMFHDLK